MNGKQGVVAGVTQVPAPSQVDSAVNGWSSAGQVAARQGVPGGRAGRRRLALAVGAAGRRGLHRRTGRRGSIVPVATLVQVRRACRRRTTCRRRRRRWSQQTPCAQKLLLHSAARRADAPWSFRPHEFARAGVRRQALGVGRAGVEAARAVADERGAGDRVGRDALAGRVAGRRRRVDVGGAGLGGAHRADRLALAAAGAVALAVGAAGRCAIVLHMPRGSRRRRPRSACSGPATTAARSCGRRRCRPGRSRRRRRSGCAGIRPRRCTAGRSASGRSCR